jgi:hypothetical protein
MLIATIGAGSNAAGEFHHPFEITFESRKGRTGFYIGLYFPQQYHKSVVDLGPFKTLLEAQEAIRLAAGGNLTAVMNNIYATYGVSSVREIFRDAYMPCRAAGTTRWDTRPERSLIARFEQEAVGLA